MAHAQAADRLPSHSMAMSMKCFCTQIFNEQVCTKHKKESCEEEACL